MSKPKAIIVSGYFNPLHKGHLELFQKAKAAGDQLWIIVNSDLQRELKGSKEFMLEQERLIIVKAIGLVDKALVSIDKDKTQCATLADLADKYSGQYELYFANGGDQNNDSIPEVSVCKEKGIVLLEGLGDKIQSSSWLLKNKMSKILVTGGAGFVGTNLIIELIKLGHKIVSIDDYSIGTKTNHQAGVNYIEGDTNDISELIHNNFDICFHLAGLSRIQPSFEDPESTFKANTEGTLKVLNWARNNNTKVIYSGSSSKHHDPTISPYAMFKYLGEEICKLYKITYEMNIEIVRFYNVYGPYEIIDGKWAALIGKWRGQIKEGKPLTIVGDGNQRRDFTHIIDIVDGLIKIAFSNQTQQDAWELGSGKNYSINEVLEMFQRKFDVLANYIENQKGNYLETLRESDQAIDLLGWNPEDRLQDYILNLKND